MAPNRTLLKIIKHPQTLVYSKGVPVARRLPLKGTPKEAGDFLDAQNKILGNQLAELTYGPKRPEVQSFIPQWAKLDNKVLVFDGYIKEKLQDYDTEKHRVHFVKVYYYLENDTLRVFEPKVPNSGYYQGPQFKRDRYLHPSTKRNYNWKDFNIGNDIVLFGKTIHLYNCDIWTREYLTESGIEVCEAELPPENPLLLERKWMNRRKEIKDVDPNELHPLRQFYASEGKVLRFYGIWKNDKETPVGIRRIVLNYHLADDTLEIFENWPPSSGRGPMTSHGRNILDNIPINSGFGSWMTVLGRQRVLLDRKSDVEKIPCYLEPLDEDDVIWIKPKHLKTGEDIQILGKVFFLSNCDEFTRHYYKTFFGIDLPQMDIIKKPKQQTPKLFPPHYYGPWQNGLEDCYKPHARLRQRPSKIPLKTKELDNTLLRFSAYMDTPRKSEHIRHFIITFYMADDTMKIYEERVENSGFGGGIFLQRCRLRKDQGKISDLTSPVARGHMPVYYEASDLYVGAKIRASGCTFVIKDADLSVFKFMENHPEIYPDVSPEEQKKLADAAKGKPEIPLCTKMELLQELKDCVLSVHGSSICPYPETLDIGTDLSPRNVAEDKLYSANLPITQDLLKKLLDVFTFKGKTEVNEVKTFLLAALGHTRSH